MTKRSRKWHTELEQAVFSDPESLAAYKNFQLQYNLEKPLKNLGHHSRPNKQKVTHQASPPKKSSHK
jgi:hypothetical protein